MQNYFSSTMTFHVGDGITGVSRLQKAVGMFLHTGKHYLNVVPCSPVHRLQKKLIRVAAVNRKNVNVIVSSHS